MSTLKLLNGKTIDCSTGAVLKEVQNTPPEGFVRVPTNHEAVEAVTRVRRNVEDLPAPPRNMNAISLVLMYSMFGLQDEDITIVTGMPQEVIERIRATDAYTDMQGTITEGIRDAEADRVRAIITRHGERAANRIAHFVEDEDPKVALVAARDILDRAGHRPADVVEHRHQMMGQLRVVHVKRDDKPLPEVETTYEDLSHGDGA